MLSVKKSKVENINYSPFIGEYVYSNGKRKTSIAQVRLYKGTGKIIINGLDLDTYLPVNELKDIIKSPLLLTKNLYDFDISIVVRGGGKSSQSEAMRHGIARALTKHDLELRPTLKKAGYLKRDSRIKERKKPGLKRARRAPQWS